MIFEATRVIVTKRKTYTFAADAVGIPVEEAFPGAKLPAILKGAKLYQTEDGPVIAGHDTGSF